MNFGAQIKSLSPWIDYKRTKRELEAQMRRASLTHPGRSQGFKATGSVGTSRECSPRASDVPRISSLRSSNLKLSVLNLKESVKKLKSNFQNSSLVTTRSSSPDFRPLSWSYNGGDGQFTQKAQTKRSSLRLPGECQKRVTFIEKNEVIQRVADMKETRSSDGEENGVETNEAQEQIEEVKESKQTAPILIDIPPRETFNRVNTLIPSYPIPLPISSTPPSPPLVYYLRVTAIRGKYFALDSPAMELVLGRVACTQVGFRGRVTIGGFRLFPSAEAAMNSAPLPASSHRISLLKVKLHDSIPSFLPNNESSSPSILPFEFIPSSVAASFLTQSEVTG